MSKIAAQHKYMNKSTTGNGQNGGYVTFEKKPSKQLINARIESKKAEMAYYAEARKPARFELFGRQEKKFATLEAKQATSGTEPSLFGST